MCEGYTNLYQENSKPNDPKSESSVLEVHEDGREGINENFDTNNVSSTIPTSKSLSSVASRQSVEVYYLKNKEFARNNQTSDSHSDCEVDRVVFIPSSYKPSNDTRPELKAVDKNTQEDQQESSELCKSPREEPDKELFNGLISKAPSCFHSSASPPTTPLRIRPSLFYSSRPEQPLYSRMVATSSSQQTIYRSVPPRPLSFGLSDMLDPRSLGYMGGRLRSSTAPISSNTPEEFAHRFKARPTTRPRIIEFDGSSVTPKGRHAIHQHPAVSNGFPTARAKIYIGQLKARSPSDLTEVGYGWLKKRREEGMNEAPNRQ